MAIPILSDLDFIFSDISIKHHTPNFYTEGLNFVGSAKSRGLHRLEMNFKITLENSSDTKRMEAFLLTIRGRLQPFYISLSPEEWHNPLYTNASPLLGADIAIGQHSMVLSGVSDVIPAGSKFQFANDDKVYTTLTDGRNNTAVEFFPSSRQAHAIKERLNFNPTMLVRMTDDVMEIKYERASDISFHVMEAL
ncbi:hypothetical protein ACJ7VZ_05410 [Aeromonas salmonicida]|uniref:hypothetical protein n=1 Tax=Aeromonas salmonicida TaxID=645 RepID=UPI0038BC2742